MKQAPFVNDAQIAQTVETIASEDFTILDFIRTFAELYPAAWNDLVAAYGEKGDGTRRSYTAATYLGNRLSQLTKKPSGPLLPLMRWQRGGVATPNQRPTTAAERKMGAGAIIRVFRKRNSA